MASNSSLYNQSLERELVGIILAGLHDNHFNECRRVLSHHDFSLPVCKAAWQVFGELYDRAQPVNIVSTVLTAQRMGIDMPPDIYELQSVGTDGDLMAYALELHTLASKRRLLNVMQQVIDDIQEPDYGVEDVSTAILRAIDNESRSSEAVAERWSQIYIRVLEHAERQMNGAEPEGCFCGLRGFDAHGGLLPGDLNIIAGRTSQGKSSLALSIALGAALRGAPVAVYSIEMPVRDLSFRLSAMLSGIPAERIERTALSSEEFSALYTSLQPRLIAEAPIFFDRNKTSDAERIIQSVRRMVAEVGIKVAFIDYAQLLTARGNVEQRVLIGRTANALKALAVELGITVFLLSQLARPVRGGNNVPRLNELKESGELENAADNVYLVYRPEIYQEQFPNLSQDWSRYDTAGNALIIRAKARKCPVGEFLMGFDGKLTKFYDREQYNAAERAIDEDTPF